MAPAGKLQKKAESIGARLKARHPDAHIELDFQNPLELLVATILSAQCTDARVNKITKELFRVFKTPEDYINKPVEELERLIQSGGFFRQKAKSIRGAAERIVREFGGVVPQTMDDLVTLSGVGRKTANVVLGNGFGIPGFPVDTHVRRIANRLGLTTSEDPEKIESELTALFPPEEWTLMSLTIIFHGRRICTARKPQCGECPVADLCDYHSQEYKKESSAKREKSAQRTVSKKAKTTAPRLKRKAASKKKG